jgi:hypothetical protein
MTPKTLPMEDMLNFGGWTLYVLMGCIVIAGIAWAGHYLYSTVKLGREAYTAFRETRELDRVLPKFQSVKRFAWFMLAARLFVFSLLVFGLSGALGSLYFEHKVQEVRFDRESCELVYRWSRFNQRIPYRAINGLKWETVPALTFSGKPSKKIGWAQVVIDTAPRTYVMISSGRGSEFQNAKAVYNELKSRWDEIRHEKK